MITSIIITAGLIYFLILVARKHEFPLNYENWYDELSDENLVKKVLPKDFCLLCFATQCSLILAVILALVLATPLWHIIIVAPCSTAFVIYLETLRHDL